MSTDDIEDPIKQWAEDHGVALTAVPGFAKREAPQFACEILVELGGDFDCDEIWPDGDWPDNPTVDNVIAMLKKEYTGGAERLVSEWNLTASYRLTVNGVDVRL